MRKMEGRALICLLLAAALLIGLTFFTVRLVKNGGNWASFYANSHVYSNGRLAVGAVYDRDGALLLRNDKDGQHYSNDEILRRATLQVVGDPGQNISTAATYVFRSEIIGYNLLTGTNGTIFGTGRDIKLTVDAEASKEAYRALAGRNGFVGVYNWKTGEVLCAVSNPGFDPASETEAASAESGAYINKVFSAAATPGSTFKLVTTAAAIENVEGLDQWTYTCNGSCEIDGEKITCQAAHGKVDIYGALAKSCNCAYGNLTVEIGSEAMTRMTEQLRLNSSYDIDGIKTTPGSFTFDTYSYNLAWAGIGQFEDQVNPLSMMVYMGAVAGEGSAASPVMLLGNKGKKINLLEASAARKLGDMMRNNVVTNYGDGNYPGLELHAKSGTAEGAKGQPPDAWFCGYSGDYAFVVCVEKGGYGSAVAGPVANRVLQSLK